MTQLYSYGCGINVGVKSWVIRDLQNFNFKKELIFLLVSAQILNMRTLLFKALKSHTGQH